MTTKLFVGKLAPVTTEQDLYDLFGKHGEVTKVDMKTGYAFVFYETEADAQHAIDNLNDIELDGHNICVEVPRTASHYRERERMRENNYDYNNNYNNYNNNYNAPKKVIKRYDLRVSVIGLDDTVSWQDLKDWARKAGDVTFANIYTKDNETMGVVEYQDADGMEEALRTLEDEPLKGRKIRLEKDESQTDYQPQQFQRPPGYVPRPKYDGGYRNNNNYDDRGGGPIRDNNYRGGGPVQHQGDRGGNYDRPYSNDRPYVNDRPNYGPPAHHGGYSDGHPPYRASGPSGYNGGGDYRMGGGGGGGYDNRGRVPIRDIPPHSGGGGGPGNYPPRGGDNRDRSRSRSRDRVLYRGGGGGMNGPTGGPIGGGGGGYGPPGPRGGYDRGMAGPPAGPRGGYDRGMGAPSGPRGGYDGPSNGGYERGPPGRGDGQSSGGYERGPPNSNVGGGGGGGGGGGRYYSQDGAPPARAGYDNRAGPR